MQATMRKIVALFVSITLALVALAAVQPAQAHAASTGSLTVTSTSAEFNGKTVTAWKMFDATVSADGGYAYTLTADWEGLFKQVIPSAEQGDKLSQAAYTYVLSLKDDAVARSAFAKKASDYAKENDIVATGTATAAPSATGYAATFDALPYGYYVISPEGGSTSTDRDTDAILTNVVRDSYEFALKSEYPTVSKTVMENGVVGNVADAQVGDELTFTLTSKVPDMSEYAAYTFNFIDTLSKGLTFVDDSVSMSIGESGIPVPTTDFTVTPEPQLDGTTKLTISMVDFKGKHADKAGQKLTVIYQATVNESAEAEKDDAGNTVKLQYSNKPGTNELGESVPSTTHGYTFDFDIKKVDGAHKALPGAEFQLQKKGGAPLSLIVVRQGTATDSLVVRPAKAGEMGAVTTVTSPESGLIFFRGLDAGEYELVETKAPAGYNKLIEPIKVVITPKYVDGVLQLPVSVTVDGTNGSTAPVEVQNSKGIMLPGTGGMGTVVFTVAGTLAIIAGVVWAVRRKRCSR